MRKADKLKSEKRSRMKKRDKKIQAGRRERISDVDFSHSFED